MHDRVVVQVLQQDSAFELISCEEELLALALSKGPLAIETQ